MITQNEKDLHVSSRPSDAIALAARTGAPVFAAVDVLDAAGIEIKDDQEEAEVEAFREFLEDLSPKTFSPVPKPRSTALLK